MLHQNARSAKRLFAPGFRLHSRWPIQAAFGLEWGSQTTKFALALAFALFYSFPVSS